MTNSEHLPDDLLVRYAEGELDEGQAIRVRSHIAECPDCAQACDEFRKAVDAYIGWYRDRKRRLPAPPLPWRPPFEQPRVAEMRRPRSRVVFRWAAVAAAAAFAFVTWQLSTRQTVSAAELLDKASVRERSAPPRREIQIRTPRQTLRRPAVAAHPATAAEAGLRQRFESAGFSWDDPLSARSFAAWRGRLSAKSDDVRIMDSGAYGPGRHYQIRTTTSEGQLAEATITLRAADMLAVRETLQFRDSEWVEITEAPAVDPVLPAPQIASESPHTGSPAAADVPQTRASAADELRVFAALHQLGADLGEPVGIGRDEARGKVVISMLGLDPAREQEIRAAIAGLPNAVIQIEQPEAMRPPNSAARRGATARPNPELESQVGSGPVLENFVNDVLDHSDGALARAHALRTLASRFPPEAEAQFAAAERATLDGIVRDHMRALAQHAARLRTLLKPFVGDPRAGSASGGRWQDDAPGLLAAAQTLDAILSEYVAGSGGSAERVAAALADLERRIAAQP